MSNWIDEIPESDRATYTRGGFGERQQVGTKVALLVIDVTYGFTGEAEQTLEEAIENYVTACGPIAWCAVPKIKSIIDFFRTLDNSVIYTRSSPEDTPFSGRATKSKNLSMSISQHDNSFLEL